MRKADLHIHTTASDEAVLEPEHVFQMAQERGLAALAFADHDGMGNVETGKRLAAEYGVAFLPGIEISSAWEGELAHVLAYFPAGAAPSFAKFLAETVWAERRRVQLTLLKRLQGQGVAITVAEYDAEAEAGGYHLPLFRLLFNKGVLLDVHEYLALRAAEGVQFRFPPIPQVIQAVHEAGGIGVVAHPGHPGADDVRFFRFDAKALTVLAAEGLNGVEVFHPAHSETQRHVFAQAADRLGLVKTGGSDSHRTTGPAEKQVGATCCDWDEVLRYLDA